jgi:putative SOS response-associated peptidase YedK
MCGRYYRRSDKQRIGDAFNISDLPSSLIISEADYNVAPTTFQPVFRNDRETGERELLLMRWGLVPFFHQTAVGYQRHLHHQRQSGDGREKPDLASLLRNSSL